VSYLSWPRLHFAGTFLSDPSTVNNDPRNVAVADTETFDRNAAWKPSRASWNPEGKHAFSFKNVTVRSALGADGAPVTGDPVLGLTLRTPTAAGSAAKLVDLDVDQQMVSMIFGLQVTLRDTAGTIFLTASMEPVPFVDIWRRGTGSIGDGAASATYQSVLTNLQWEDVTSSPLLTQLRAAAGDGLLSVKFTLDGYVMAATKPDGSANPDFASGRIVGTVGAATADEPVHMVLGRQFGGPELLPPLDDPTPGFLPGGGVNFFTGVIDTVARKIRLDLGNALRSAGPGTPVPDMGMLMLACREVDGSVTPAIATIDYGQNGWYERTAGVVDLPADRTLTDDELALVAARPLALVTFNPQTGLRRVVIEETPVYVRADTMSDATAAAPTKSFAFVARLDPADRCVVRLYVTERGMPKAGAQVNLRVRLPVDPSTGAVPPGMAELFPEKGLTFPASVTTDAQGIAEVTLVAGDPGPVRAPADGEVYGIACHVDGVAAVNPSNRLSVLVWNAYGPDNPAPTSWDDGIGAIFRAYGNLYPSMTHSAGLDVAVRKNVLDRASDIADRLGRPITDPRYMPVTRDLSGAKKKALLAWLDNPPPGDLAPAEEVATGEPAAPAPEPDIGPGPGGKTLFAERTVRGLDPEA
jgi:hypothetical protein